MTKQDKQIKLTRGNYLFVRKAIGVVGIDKLGREVINTKWEKANGEINLGSLKEPNREIVEFEWNIPENAK